MNPAQKQFSLNRVVSIKQFPISISVSMMLGFTSLTMAQAWQSCSNQTKVTYGNYSVYNNMWGASSGTCMWANSINDWGATATYSNGGGNVKAYASAFRGDHYGLLSAPNNGLPIQLSQLTSATAKWNVVTPTTGRYMCLWDIYYRKTGAATGDYDCNLMIFHKMADATYWIGGSSDPNNSANYIGKVTLSGYEWRVAEIRNDSRVNNGPVWIFYPTNPTSSTNNPNGRDNVSINLKEFHDWMIGRGLIKPSYYLSVVEVGWELIEATNSQFLTTAFEILLITKK
jgi:hypothetical protein